VKASDLRRDPLQALIDTAAEADKWHRLYDSLHMHFVAAVATCFALACGLLAAIAALLNR
jgi:hypothetical protein